MNVQAEAFQAMHNVSRETMERLEIYAELLKKWNQRINLVSKNTIPDLWTRHFSDSAAAYPIAKNIGPKWVDLGSGAGFPALVLAILAKEKNPEIRMTCIETDLRKSEFLRTVARQTDVKLNILSRRIEDAPPQAADCIFARALAPLTQLLKFADQHMGENGIACFHKGEDWVSEVEAARKQWHFIAEPHSSATNSASVILRISDLSHV